MLKRQSSRKFNISLIGYASDKGGILPGVDQGPRVLRDLKLIERLENLGHLITDLGDVISNPTAEDEKALTQLATPEERKTKNLLAVYSACRQVAEKTNVALEANSFPLIIGGDHTVSIGSVAAIANHIASRGEKLGLIWIDTHPDVHTPTTSPSMALFGMATSILLGRMPGGLLSSMQKYPPAIRPENMVYVGLQDVEVGEPEAIKELNLAAFTMKEIDIDGIAKVITKAIDIASNGTTGFVASFDLDVCDASLAPGTEKPQRGGLTFRESHLVAELLFDSQKMLAFEIVELDPLLDRDFLTAELAVLLIESAFGKSIL